MRAGIVRRTFSQDAGHAGIKCLSTVETRFSAPKMTMDTMSKTAPLRPMAYVHIRATRTNQCASAPQYAEITRRSSAQCASAYIWRTTTALLEALTTAPTPDGWYGVLRDRGRSLILGPCRSPVNSSTDEFWGGRS